ncbi:MAG: HDOD domain-containing protein, partial [Candidatus Cloacimonetes bacterium]|nr:HDOD domain-containing protein [Candidatus Cloacimonadota bacterium]
AVFSKNSTESILKSSTKKEIENHCLKVAEIAQEITRFFSTDTEIIDNVFVSSLMHDFGKIVLLEISNEYVNLLHEEKNVNRNIVEKEMEMFGTSHCEIGAYLLSLWGLPDSILEGVAYHHNPSQADTPYIPLVAALHIANVLAVEYDVNKIEDFKTLDKNFIKENSYSEILEKILEKYHQENMEAK